MIIPIVKIPASIADGLSIYRNLFPRRETYEHIQQYCTGLVVLDKPSILRMSQCLVNGPCQSSLNKAITSSPWSEPAVNDRRIESVAPYHQTGLTVLSIAPLSITLEDRTSMVFTNIGIMWRTIIRMPFS